jgi:hypothetical protein
VHFSKKGLGSDVLIVRPGYGSKHDSHLIEVVHLLQFPKHPVIQIGFEVKDSFAPILYFHIDTVS